MIFAVYKKSVKAGFESVLKKTTFQSHISMANLWECEAPNFYASIFYATVISTSPPPLKKE